MLAAEADGKTSPALAHNNPPAILQRAMVIFVIINISLYTSLHFADCQ
jgi:hypothetical protein